MCWMTLASFPPLFFIHFCLYFIYFWQLTPLGADLFRQKIQISDCYTTKSLYMFKAKSYF